MLDFSKIEARELTISITEFRLRTSMRSILLPLECRASQKGLKLKYSIDPAIPDLLSSDPVRLYQILTNLVGNAIKFTDRGGVSLNVLKTAEEPGGISLQFSIQDTGIGLAAEKQEEIFLPFRQADNSFTRRFGGTGLGLSITKQLTTLLGGRIWLESEIGKGSTFHVSLPFGIPG